MNREIRGGPPSVDARNAQSLLNTGTEGCIITQVISLQSFANCTQSNVECVTLIERVVTAELGGCI